MSGEPAFEPDLVDNQTKDGYWIQAVDVNGDGRPDLVTSGLAEGRVVWYENPGWAKHPICALTRPVALDQVDIAGEGRRDLVVCHDYARTMFEATPADGTISWLRNPGHFDRDEAWEVRTIGHLGSTHRLRAGHFTGREDLEVLALPVIGPLSGRAALHAPVRVTLYRRPVDVLGSGGWESDVVDDSTFRVIHAAALGEFGPPSPPGRLATVLASEEGLTWFGVDDHDSWTSVNLAAGETTEQPQTGYKGSANLAIGRLGGQPNAYIAAVEPFHGNVLAFYAPEGGSGVVGSRWHRTVIERFGEPNEAGEGPAHHVVCADFDGDGDDEFLVALRGPSPHQGVVHYKVTDVQHPALVRTPVSSQSAARIAVADFDGDGRLDFATTGYYVPGYFLCSDPQTVVFYNRFGKPVPDLAPIPYGPLGG